MRRLLTQLVLVSAALVGLELWLRQGWLLAGLGGVALAFLWKLGRCPHPRPLGLLPPVVDSEGNRTAPQWYCGQCGERFPADFAHDRSPIQRFHGYDESKARDSARRAAELDSRRRQLAVKRAGMMPGRLEPARPVVRTAGPVPIRGGRLAG